MKAKEKKENRSESNEALSGHVYTEEETSKAIKDFENIHSFEELKGYMESSE